MSVAESRSRKRRGSVLPAKFFHMTTVIDAPILLTSSRGSAPRELANDSLTKAASRPRVRGRAVAHRETGASGKILSTSV
jgi:hypothetical protein